MKTEFYYHRYSTEMERDSYTLEAQIRITKEIAEKYGTKITKQIQKFGFAKTCQGHGNAKGRDQSYLYP